MATIHTITNVSIYYINKKKTSYNNDVCYFIMCCYDASDGMHFVLAMGCFRSTKRARGNILTCSGGASGGLVDAAFVSTSCRRYRGILEGDGGTRGAVTGPS